MLEGDPSADLQGAYNGVVVSTNDDTVLGNARSILASGQAAVAQRDYGQARASVGELRDLSTRLQQQYELHVVSTFTPTGGETQTEVEDNVKKAPRNGRLATCTFHVEDSSDEGVFTLDGTVKISYTKAR